VNCISTAYDPRKYRVSLFSYFGRQAQEVPMPLLDSVLLPLLDLLENMIPMILIGMEG
jgi:hypothetical protein